MLPPSRLVQPGKGALDLPITFTSRQPNSTEQNDSTTEQEGLAMVYNVKKFQHYLLASRFSFFVEHQALLYLVNKTHTTGRISRWKPIHTNLFRGLLVCIRHFTKATLWRKNYYGIHLTCQSIQLHSKIHYYM